MYGDHQNDLNDQQRKYKVILYIYVQTQHMCIFNQNNYNMYQTTKDTRSQTKDNAVLSTTREQRNPLQNTQTRINLVF